MKTLSILLALTLLLSGCRSLPTPREMEDMALLRTMGVDRGEGELLVTVSTGARAEGLQEEGKPPLILSARGPSLSAAALTLQGLSDSYVFFGYVDQLLLGEDLVRDSVLPVLDYFARDAELGLGARLWVVRGGAGEAALRTGEQEGVERRLTTLGADGEMGLAPFSRTAEEVYADLLERGASYAPALRLSEGEGAALVSEGYAVLKEEKLAGYLEGEEARGLELLAGKPSAHVVEVTLPGGAVSVRVSGAATACRFTREGRLSLDCRVTAQLAEYRRPLTREELDQVRRTLEERETARVRGALDRLRGWQADCLGLGAKAALSAPGQWSAMEKDWPQLFGTREPELRLCVVLHD